MLTQIRRMMGKWLFLYILKKNLYFFLNITKWPIWTIPAIERWRRERWTQWYLFCGDIWNICDAGHVLFWNDMIWHSIQLPWHSASPRSTTMKEFCLTLGSLAQFEDWWSKGVALSFHKKCLTFTNALIMPQWCTRALDYIHRAVCCLCWSSHWILQMAHKIRTSTPKTHT